MSKIESSLNSSPDHIHFFVRMISNGKTLVLHGKPEDKVKVIHENIQTVTGIPTFEQRLIYKGRQLDIEHSLAECMIENDGGLHLVGRLRSTNDSPVLILVETLVSNILRICKYEKPIYWNVVEPLLTAFLQMISREDINESHLAMLLDIFQSLGAPAAMVMFYMYPLELYKMVAHNLILAFLLTCKTGLRKPFNAQCAPVVLEFCNLLRGVGGQGDSVYSTCRTSLASMVKELRIGRGLRKHDEFNSRIRLVGVTDIFPFVAELAKELIEDLDSTNISSTKVCDFAEFLKPVIFVFRDLPPFKGGIRVPMMYTFPCYDVEVKLLYSIFSEMLEKMVKYLEKVKGQLHMEQKEDAGWDQYLSILKRLGGISKLYQGAEDTFWANMDLVSASLRYLIVQYANRFEDYGWIIGHKYLLDFKCRRHLVMLLLHEMEGEEPELPEMEYEEEGEEAELREMEGEEPEELHKIIIDRSQLLSDSFNCISNLQPENLNGGFLIKFKDEEAIGPGVIREWFFLVCQEIFNPRNALFVACPNDQGRFFPNPASKVNPMHLEYFKFAGRVIALALMHDIQVGIMFDRSFYLQLAGLDISLEDIKDADPYFYSSCKQILDMDSVIVDEDALGLTFIHEVEEAGSMEVIELIANGKNIVVNSRNRDEYVQVLIRRRFLISVAEQVAEFANGFADVVGHQDIRKLVFYILDFEDHDGILHGSKNIISLEDWKAHTEYNGYKETDSQIYWFWKIVEEMTAEQQKVLLFFWTSLKHLPMEGFFGLDSKLYIYKSNDSINCLPSSHTCFYRLCFPSYPSMAVMRQRLEVITQDHVGCGFGKW